MSGTMRSQTVIVEAITLVIGSPRIQLSLSLSACCLHHSGSETSLQLEVSEDCKNSKHQNYETA
jgi:hypothetical protein